MPLFPLRTVLFPGMPLPLRIFEDRYKTMVRELLASGREFGVILIREGQEVGGGARPHRVGTLARIEDATELPGGRFAIDTRGTRRFRLQRMLRPRPYPYGEIEIIEEPSPANTPQLQHAMETVRTTFPLYFRLALSLSDQWAQALKLPVRPHELVDFIAPWLQLDEEPKQRLLELEAAQDRVAHLAEVLDDLLLRTREEVEDHRRTKYRAIGSGN
ncbi:LON peptidase substrate-binding domain-containing protein [Candidatus Amarobacter glycogenicus]|uniref:LON peptidase substrate-binding domain-containing protein n=1 Tax=Candidatus Amarobacter glycogenicus TaxID=3140699 RepID=UPI002A11A1DD|nr:LON peptidase substrate-binding domain-containing protein [Dehalococcoidia bacterium]